MMFVRGGSIDPVYWNFIRAIYGTPAWEHEVEVAEQAALEEEFQARIGG
jgi:hypothetical protein